MVEMIETAYILNSATKDSLVIMDEVGRGTSTEDGLAIAQAVSEYLLNSIGAKTLFATHYHELSRLMHRNLVNLQLEVLETEGKIVFLKKVIKGTAGNSYGIHVAGLAGIPIEVLTRAKNLLYMINQFKAADTAIPAADGVALHTAGKENTLFSEEEIIINEIISLNPDGITPMQALQFISEWKAKLLQGNK